MISPWGLGYIFASRGRDIAIVNRIHCLQQMRRSLRTIVMQRKTR